MINVHSYYMSFPVQFDTLKLSRTSFSLSRSQEHFPIYMTATAS